MRFAGPAVMILGFLAAGCDDASAPSQDSSSSSSPVADSTDPSHSWGDGGWGDDRDGDGKVYGVDAENYLVTFDRDRPQEISRRVRITGTGGQKIVGIDFRPSAVAPANPANIGKLYGITKTTIYTIDRRTGVASNGRTLTIPLAGTFFGTGFNPVVDRWRDHSNTEQNLRLSVDNGATIQDAPLAYEAGDRNFGKDPSVTGTGYTNSDNDPNTGTELYAIDAKQDVLVELNTPNNGQLSTVGRLNVRTNDYVGFDIPGEQSRGSRYGYSSLTVADRYYQSWNWGGRSGYGGSTLYRVNLDTGEARQVGNIGNRSPLVSIALEPVSSWSR